MKNLLLLVCFLFIGSMSINAQACNKTGKKCCAKKSQSMSEADAKVDAASMTADIAAADDLASKDENIQVRVNATNGEKSYYMKSTCEKSGKVSWDEVKYCGESKKFTKVASASMERDLEEAASVDGMKKACCAKGEKKSCCSKGEKKDYSKKESESN